MTGSQWLSNNAGIQCIRYPNRQINAFIHQIDAMLQQLYIDTDVGIAQRIFRNDAR